MSLAALLTLAGIHTLIALSPGPASVLMIKTAASNGGRAGTFLGIGFAVAAAIWAAAALAGLSLIFEVAPYLQTALRISGGVFLVWIGFHLWRHAGDPLPDPGESTAQRSGLGAFRLGVLTNFANPKALAYFTAVFVGIIPNDPTLLDSAIILALILGIEITWYTGMAVIFSRSLPRRVYSNAKSWLDRAFGGIVALIGAKLATS